MKTKKAKHKEAHSSNQVHGMGDYYGTGVRNKFGRLRDSSNPGFIPLGEKKLKIPPRSIV